MELMKFGADPNNLYGVDILPERIEEGRRKHPSIHFQCANSESLPFGDAEFDVVMQYTTFVAIDDTSRSQIAKEMVRVLKPGGVILWNDFRVDHPFRKELRGISKRQLKEYFGGLSIWTEAIMLPPAFARLIARFSIIVCEVLEKLPLLCSAYFAVIRKPLS
jgi:ubiquinone/menaquinone biosynthesis C-methylase UbiE